MRGKSILRKAVMGKFSQDGKNTPGNLLPTGNNNLADFRFFKTMLHGIKLDQIKRQ